MFYARQAYCSNNGVYIRLVAVDPADPIRNIRIITPGFLARRETCSCRGDSTPVGSRRGRVRPGHRER